MPVRTALPMIEDHGRYYNHYGKSTLYCVVMGRFSVSYRYFSTNNNNNHQIEGLNTSYKFKVSEIFCFLLVAARNTLSSHKRNMLSNNSFFHPGGSECETNSDWDYDDVNSLLYGYQGCNPGNDAEKSLLGDNNDDDSDVTEMMKWIYDTSNSPSVPTRAKSIGTETLDKQLSVHTTTTTGMSESWSSSANATTFYPVTAAGAPPTMPSGTVPEMPTTDDHLLGLGNDFLETPLQLLLLTDAQQLKHPTVNGNSDNADVAFSNNSKEKAYPQQQPKQQLVSPSKSVESSVFSVPCVLEIARESLHSNTSSRSNSCKKQLGEGIHETRATASIAPKEESAIPATPNHQDLENLYEQLQLESCSSQKHISQQYLYLQQQQLMVQEIQATQLEIAALPSREDEWQKNFVMSQRDKRSGKSSSEAASVQAAARHRKSSAANRRRSSAASRLLAKSCAEATFSIKHEAVGDNMVNTEYSVQLGLDKEMKNEYSRCSSQLLTREQLSETNAPIHSEFFKTGDSIDDAAEGQNQQQQAETIRLDTGYYKSSQKRKSVFWRFAIVSWKVASFQWCGSYEHHDSKVVRKREDIEVKGL